MADKFMDTLAQQARDAQAAADQRERAARITATYGNAIASGYRRRWPVTYKVDDAPGGAQELETLLNTRADEGWRFATFLVAGSSVRIVFEREVEAT